jgi:arylsulfatase A-like enzyme
MRRGILDEEVGRLPRTMMARDRPLTALIVIVLLTATMRAQDPGNVLILTADDMGGETLAAYGVGNDVAITPTLDAMAAGGVLFRNVWSTPKCSSTRATLQTGRHCFRTGIGEVIGGGDPPLPLAETTLPEMLALGAAPHATALIGKWHLSNDQSDPVTGQPIAPDGGGALHPELQGYDHFAGSLTFIGPSYFV